MTIVSKHAANLAALGMSYWAPGPVTGTLWALHSDSCSPVLVDAQYEIVGAMAGTPAQHKAATRGMELNVAVRVPGSQPVYQSGAYVIGVSYPLPEHEHFYRAGWREDEGHSERHASGACSVYVPYDRKANVQVNHIPATPVVVPAPVPTRARAYRRRVAA